jgi:hypothetical protein
MRRRRVEDALLSMPSLSREEGGRFLPLTFSTMRRRRVEDALLSNAFSIQRRRRDDLAPHMPSHQRGRRVEKPTSLERGRKKKRIPFFSS